MKAKRQLRSRQVIPSDPEWEALEASCSSVGHAEAVARSAHLTEQYRRMWQREAHGVADVYTAIRTLRAKKVSFVLTGAYGIASWTGRPRATSAVDILVKGGRNLVRVVKALREAFPSLEVRQFAGVTSFFLPGEKQSLIDVTYPHRADLAETLATAVWVKEKAHRYRVPTLEAALANKYGAMLTPDRNPGKRGQDAVNFGFMVKHSMDEGRQPIDLDKLRDLGEKVRPGGGGAEILRLVEEAKRGQVPNVTPPT